MYLYYINKTHDNMTHIKYYSKKIVFIVPSVHFNVFGYNTCIKVL